VAFGSFFQEQHAQEALDFSDGHKFMFPLLRCFQCKFLGVVQEFRSCFPTSVKAERSSCDPAKPLTVANLKASLLHIAQRSFTIESFLSSKECRFLRHKSVLLLLVPSETRVEEVVGGCQITLLGKCWWTQIVKERLGIFPCPVTSTCELSLIAAAKAMLLSFGIHFLLVLGSILSILVEIGVAITLRLELFCKHYLVLDMSVLQCWQSGVL
jgi:hypothetical protein